MNECPFKVGDWVVYKPCQRTRGWDPYDPLEIGYAYKVVDIKETEGIKGLVVEGNPRPNWGIYWELFQSLPDFYLATHEGNDQKKIRECRFMKRLKGNYHGDWMLVDVDPPAYGKTFGMTTQDVDVDAVLILPQHEGGALFPVSEYPMSVRIAQVLVNPKGLKERIRENEYKIVGQGELHKTRLDANRALGFSDNERVPRDYKNW